MEPTATDAAASPQARAGPRPFYKRRRYLIDTRLQMGVVLPLVAVPVVAGIAYVVGVLVLPGEAVWSTLTAPETRKLFLRANLVYSALATAGLGAVAIILTHRIAGPLLVIERAVRCLARGDASQRLRLRPGDAVKPLAAAVVELRDALQAQEARRQRLLDEIDACLRADDVAGARPLLEQLRATPPVGMGS